MPGLARRCGPTQPGNLFRFLRWLLAAYLAGAPEFIWPEERASCAVQARMAGAPDAYHTDPIPGITSNAT
jgi:hypothetical protein